MVRQPNSQKIKSNIKRYTSSHADEWAASITFFALLSLPAASSFLMWILLHFVTPQDIQTLMNEMTSTLPSHDVQSLLNSFVALQNTRSGVQSIIAVVIAVFAASKIFLHITYALQDIWNVQLIPKKKKLPLKERIRIMLTTRIKTVLPVVTIGVVGLVIIILNIVWNALLPTITQIIAIPQYLLQAISILVVIGALILLCTAIFYFLSNKQFEKKSYIHAGLISALLLVVGQVVLGFYFRFGNITQGFGSIGAVIALLVWMYYSISIFLFGATFICTKECGPDEK